jgi:hypothetical protein
MIELRGEGEMLTSGAQGNHEAVFRSARVAAGLTWW